ncbi:MAG: hypothetical protein VX938_06305, partial [Myxococcota bacterium]|nr:hypothetical protein [Myxococcota bacterium]
MRDLRLPLGASDRALRERAARALGLALDEVAEVRVEKRSIDARGSAPLHVVTVRLWTHGESIPADELPRPDLPPGLKALVPGEAPIVVGTGPAGLWAAL